MKNRILLTVLVLAIVIGIIWERSRVAPVPEAPPALPPVVQPAAREIPPLPSSPAPVKKKEVHISPKTKPAPKKVSGAPSGAPATTILPVPMNPPPPAIPPSYEPPPLLEWKGNNDTSITHSGQIVVKNDHQWIHVWSEHHPHEAAPDVDFSQNMVVGVFLGQRPADGFKVDITGARTLPDAVMVDYVETAPPPGTFAIGVAVYPYDIKVIPHSALPVKFNPQRAAYQAVPARTPSPAPAMIPSTATK
jgi:hypothetical protein